MSTGFTFWEIDEINEEFNKLIKYIVDGEQVEYIQKKTMLCNAKDSNGKSLIEKIYGEVTSCLKENLIDKKEICNCISEKESGLLLINQKLNEKKLKK